MSVRHSGEILGRGERSTDSGSLMENTPSMVLTTVGFAHSWSSSSLSGLMTEPAASQTVSLPSHEVEMRKAPSGEKARARGGLASVEMVMGVRREVGAMGSILMRRSLRKEKSSEDE